MAALVAAVIAYYLSDAAIGTDMAFSGGEALIWSVAGLFAGSVMGAIGGAAAPVNPRWLLMALSGVALLTLIAVGMIRVSVLALGQWPLFLALAITFLFTVTQLRTRQVQLRTQPSS